MLIFTRTYLRLPGRIILQVLIFTSLIGCDSTQDQAEATRLESAGRAVYQLQFVFIKDAGKFLEYQQKKASLVAKHGGQLELTIVADQMWSKDNVKPDVVNLIRFENADSQSDLATDTAYSALSELRAEAMVAVSVSGASIGGSPVDGQTDTRAYLVEFVEYLGGNASGYREYESFSAEVMGRYGYHLEREIQPTASDGIGKPDLIRIMYFDTTEQFAAMQNDADFANMMRLYEESVERSLWVMGKTPPDIGGIKQLLGGG